MRQRIKIKKMSGSYVVVWPVTVGDQTLFSYSKEKVFSPAIGFNAYAKARTFAMNKAMKLANQTKPPPKIVISPAEPKTMTLKITGTSPLICHNIRYYDHTWRGGGGERTRRRGTRSMDKRQKTAKLEFEPLL